MNGVSTLLRGVPGAARARRLARAAVHLSRSLASPFLHTHPAGHFYSPIPEIGELRRREAELFDTTVRELPGIELNDADQLSLLSAFSRHARDCPYPELPNATHRFHYENSYFSYGDAAVLYGILREYRPRRVIEVGSGFSSAAMLDAADADPGREVSFTFVDPYPERLLGLLRAADRQRCEILRQPVQSLPAGLIDALEANDILFIDSSHVVRTGSDVVHVIANLLPRLRPGVLVHFHDVFWPFEYPPEWVLAGTAWSEAYMLRAFLEFNHAFRIRYFNSYMARHQREEVAALLPVCLRNPGGSIWLQRV